jgi:tetratricopeptide (TPR) repeat protein
VSPATRAAVARADDAERSRRHDEARRRYEQAVRDAADAPSAAYAHRAHADALLLWGERAGAAAALEAVVVADPRATSAWHDLGIVRHSLGDLAGAEAALRRSIALAPRDPRSHLALAALLWKSGRRDAARAAYQTLLGLDLPERVRAKVEWAIGVLGQPQPRPAAPPAPPAPP